MIKYFYRSKKFFWFHGSQKKCFIMGKVNNVPGFMPKKARTSFLLFFMLLSVLIAQTAIAQTEVIYVTPPWTGSPSSTVYICEGGSVTVSVQNSTLNHLYKLMITAPFNETLGDLTGTGETISFSPYTFTDAGTFTLFVGDMSDVNPMLTFYVNVVDDPVAPVMAKDPGQAAVCAGTDVSATVTTAGSGGVPACNDIYEYSTNSGSTWSAYTPGTAISTTGLSGTDIVQIRSSRADAEGRG